MVLHELNAPKDHHAAEGVGPAALVLAALVNDLEGGTAVLAQGIDLVPSFAPWK